MNEKAIFIRHNFNPEIEGPEYLNTLWSEHRIAVQFENTPSTDPKDYDGAGKVALKRLNDYCKSGAVVGATYREIGSPQIMVGRISPGSEIEVVDRDGLYKKEIQLIEARPVNYLDYPILMIQPIKGTVAEWHIGQKTLEAIVNRQLLEPELDLLHPSQLEVLCYEYLRLIGRLDALILPIGRTLRDIDIWGLRQNGEQLIAQVTHSESKSEIREKKKILRKYASPDTSLIFFGPKLRQDYEGDPDIEYIPIEDVFEYLNSGQAGDFYKQLIRAMLGKIASQ